MLKLEILSDRTFSRPKIFDFTKILEKFNHFLLFYAVVYKYS